MSVSSRGEGASSIEGRMKLVIRRSEEGSIGLRFFCPSVARSKPRGGKDRFLGWFSGNDRRGEPIFLGSALDRLRGRRRGEGRRRPFRTCSWSARWGVRRPCARGPPTGRLGSHARRRGGDRGNGRDAGR